MGLLELVRRVGLLGGLCTCCWYYLDTPRLLLDVKPANFQKDYEREYGKRDYPVMGVMEMGREFLRKHTNPGSVEAYVKRVTQMRSLEQGGERWAAFYRALPEAGAFYAVDQPPMNAVARDIDLLFAHTRYLVLYMPVKDAAGEGHLEIHYWNQPKQSKAPTRLLYPKRAWAWLWLAGGLALYLLLPRPKARQGSSGYGWAPVVILDVIGMFSASFFFGLALWVADCTKEALNEDFDTTLWCWGGAAVCSLLVLCSARMAAYRVTVDPLGLELSNLWNTRLVRFAEMTGAGYLERNEIRTGIFIQTTHGEVIRIDWANLLRFEVVMDAIQRAQIPAAADVCA